MIFVYFDKFNQIYCLAFFNATEVTWSVFQMLISASDDRSIRVWDCEFLFKDERINKDDNCVCVMYGHEARIWKVCSYFQGWCWFIYMVMVIFACHEFVLCSSFVRINQAL